jgi:ATP-dependent helicase/nuclease subunit A
VNPSPALDPRGSFSVAASAGSGKTWLLSARILRLLLAGVAPERILALSFTRKAAAEMSQRVRARLRDLAFADAATLDAQLAAIGLAPDTDVRARARGLFEQLCFSPWPLRVSTFQSFCQDLVSRFPLLAGVTPGFEIVETEGPLLDTAWQRLLLRLQAEPEGASARAAEWLIGDGDGEFGLRRTVGEFLQRRADWYAFAADDDAPVDAATAALREQLGLASDAEPALAVDEQAFSCRLTLLHRYLTTTGGSTRIRLDAVTRAVEARGTARFAALENALFKVDEEPRELIFSREAAARLPRAALDHLRQTHGEVLYELTQVRERQRRWRTLQRTRAALTLGVAALREFERDCRRRNQLGFSDLEWQACRLLAQDQAAALVQYRLDCRIDHLLVDEFQDTSPTQWRLLLPLLQEMAAGSNERTRSAFVVGDAKQSIYAFRRADPALLGEAADFIAEALGGGGAALTDSWRSAPAVIELVNTLFEQTPLATQLPGFPHHATHKSGAWGRIELAALVAVDQEPAGEPGFRDPLQQPRADPENTRALREGRLIAARIRALVDERIAIHDHGRERALDFGDVMILLRARTHASALEQALTEAGIPFVGSARATLLSTVEARDLVALLRFLDAPARDLELAHALRSPLFGASDEDLVALARAVRTGNSGWWSALRALEGSVSAPLHRAQAQLESWLSLARRLPAHDLIDRICADTGAAAAYEAALPAAQAVRVRGNLNALIQLALEADSGRYPSLGRFLAWLEQLGAREDSAPDEAPPPATGRQVRVLTIHAAKGLEAPAVFLAQCAGAAQAAQPGWQVDWPTALPHPRLLLLAGDKASRDEVSNALIEARQRSAQREEAHLAYVAVTRAQHFLHVSGFAPARGSREPSVYDCIGKALDALGVAPFAGEVARSHGTSDLPRAPVAASTTRMETIDERWHQALMTSSPAPARASETLHGDEAAARRGSAVHWLLQQLAGTVGAAPAALRERLHVVLGADFSLREFDEWLAEARGVLAAPALARFFDARALRRAWNEVPLRSESLNGVVDRLIDDGEALWILDYKTDRGAEAATLLARHREQLESYRSAVAALWPGRPVRAALIRTAPPELLELR